MAVALESVDPVTGMVETGVVVVAPAAADEVEVVVGRVGTMTVVVVVVVKNTVRTFVMAETGSVGATILKEVISSAVVRVTRNLVVVSNSGSKSPRSNGDRTTSCDVIFFFFLL